MTEAPEELCREAIRLLDEALQKPPVQLKAEVDVAERAVATLRDELIAQLRASPQPRVREGLDSVNVALSLLVGLEYPMGGLQPKMLESARTTLQSALDAGLSDQHPPR